MSNIKDKGSNIINTTTQKSQSIEKLILDLRNQQVMIDCDIASLYGVETKVLNQAVKRNINRFPERFMFLLSKEEKDELVTKCDRFVKLKHSSIKHTTATHAFSLYARPSDSRWRTGVGPK